MTTSDSDRCERCEGRRIVPRDDRRMIVCPRCNGSGKRKPAPAPEPVVWTGLAAAIFEALARQATE